MDDRRSGAGCAMLAACVVWGIVAWAAPGEDAALLLPSVLWHKVASVTLAACLCVHLFIEENRGRCVDRTAPVAGAER